MKVAFMPNLTVAPTPQGSTLPTWIYQGTIAQTGDCQPGAFVTDSGNSLTTTLVQISGSNQAGSDSTWLGAMSSNSTVVVFRDSQGRTAAYGLKSIAAIPDSGNPGCFLMNLMVPTGELQWSGGYSLTFQPAT